MEVPTPYHVVLKLGQKVTKVQAALANSYQRSLGGARFSVLFYSREAERIQKARDALPAIRVCSYSFTDFKNAFGAMERRLANSTGWRYGKIDMKFTAFTPRGITGPELVLFRAGQLAGCTPAQLPAAPWAHLWSVESDAAFIGDAVRFFDAFELEPTDLLSTGFTIGGGNYWARHLTTHEPPPSFGRADAAVRPLGGAHPLPLLLCGVDPMAAATGEPSASRRMVSYTRRVAAADIAAGPGGCNASRGPLFRITVVERLSARLVLHLADLLADGRFAFSEIFISTACAAQPWCRIGDWARGPPDPNKERGQSDRHRTPLPVPIASTATSITAPATTPAITAAPAAPTAPAAPATTPISTPATTLAATGYRSSAFFYYPARFVDVASWCEACSCVRQPDPSRATLRQDPHPLRGPLCHIPIPSQIFPQIPIRLCIPSHPSHPTLLH